MVAMVVVAMMTTRLENDASIVAQCPMTKTPFENVMQSKASTKRHE